VCVGCGERFDPTDKRQVYCSRKCWQHARVIPKEPLQLTCKVCHAPYRSYHSKSKYCSKQCRMQAVSRTTRGEGRMPRHRHSWRSAVWDGDRSVKVPATHAGSGYTSLLGTAFDIWWHLWYLSLSKRVPQNIDMRADRPMPSRAETFEPLSRHITISDAGRLVDAIVGTNRHTTHRQWVEKWITDHHLPVIAHAPHRGRLVNTQDVRALALKRRKDSEAGRRHTERMRETRAALQTWAMAGRRGFHSLLTRIGRSQAFWAWSLEQRDLLAPGFLEALIVAAQQANTNSTHKHTRFPEDLLSEAVRELDGLARLCMQSWRHDLINVDAPFHFYPDVPEGRPDAVIGNILLEIKATKSAKSSVMAVLCKYAEQLIRGNHGVPIDAVVVYYARHGVTLYMPLTGEWPQIMPKG